MPGYKRKVSKHYKAKNTKSMLVYDMMYGGVMRQANVFLRQQEEQRRMERAYRAVNPMNIREMYRDYCKGLDVSKYWEAKDGWFQRRWRND